jgi:hypothetical protein
MSMTMVRNLRERFHVFADVLVSPRRARKRLAAKSKLRRQLGALT